MTESKSSSKLANVQYNRNTSAITGYNSSIKDYFKIQRPGDVCMHQWTGSPLVQVTKSDLCANALLNTILTCFILILKNIFQLHLIQPTIFSLAKCISNCCLQTGMCWDILQQGPQYSSPDVTWSIRVVVQYHISLPWHSWINPNLASPLNTCDMYCIMTLDSSRFPCISLECLFQYLSGCKPMIPSITNENWLKHKSIFRCFSLNFCHNTPHKTYYSQWQLICRRETIIYFRV